MFTDYRLRVIENYQARRETQLLPSNLIQPTTARLKAECIKVCIERYNYKDEIILRNFFGKGANKEDCLRAIERFEVDKFKPLVNYLKQVTSETDIKNVEILAWLIDFENRPFEFEKNYDQTQSATQGQKAIGMVNSLYFKVFLSYSWANTDVADEIDNDFKKLGIQFIRDVRDAQYRTSIKDFMHKVGKSDFVLMIISDEYLRSENCMYEVNELLNTHDFEQRILPIVIENALRIFKPINRKEYYSFWQEKKTEADKNKTDFPNHDTIDYAIKCQRIVDNLPAFFQKITDINVSTFKKLREGNYKDILKIMGFSDKPEHGDILKMINPIRENQLNISKKVHDVVANGLYRIMAGIEHQGSIEKEQLLNELEILYDRSRDITYDQPESIPSDFQVVIAKLLISFADTATKVLVVGNHKDLWDNMKDRVKAELKHILQELMVNMKKHSSARNVVVRFELIGEELQINYTDDGVGLPATFRYGNGLASTGNRIQSMGGRIIFDKNMAKGLRIQIHLPIA